MARFHDLMRFAKTGIAHPDMTGFDKMKALALFPQSYPSTTITGIPPLTFRANGKPLSAWSISGNSQQTGTPTPDAPIYPEFVGERTENLLDVTSPAEHLRTTVTPLANGGVELSITNATWTNCNYRDIPVTANSTYTITIYIDEYSGTGTFMIPCRQIDGVGTAIFTDTITSTGKKTHTFTADGSTVWLGLYLNNSGTAATASAKIRIMLNEGALDQDYEPYGYKLPITCGGQTVPVYLGQTQTTRRIKKLVLDGTENWTLQKSGTASSYFSASDVADPAVQMQLVCTHYQAGEVYSSNTDTGILVLANGGVQIREENAASSDRSAFVAFLQQQYAAGTPVTIWYVLAEQTTGIVNEPLAKIGNYADTVASTNAGAPPIPTRKGANTLTVDTELQPSSVTITT